MFDQIVNRVLEKIEPYRGTGQVASYIPALAKADPRQFGLAIATADGLAASTGDAAQPFSIQSISKIFTLTLALERHGDAVWSKVGKEPSGSPFNSIVQLEREQGKPRNPLINAGAIAVTDLLLADAGSQATTAAILGFVHSLCGSETVRIDEEIAASEMAHGSRNASLAHFMKSFGVLSCSVEDALAVYFSHCALTMTCEQLARAGLFLAFDGFDPLSQKRIVEPGLARQINALMLTCGHYDASGEFALHIGLPGKSGVGGGILAIAPGIASIAVWSPGLNRNGNSLVGTLALEFLAEETGWSIFKG